MQSIKEIFIRVSPNINYVCLKLQNYYALNPVITITYDLQPPTTAEKYPYLLRIGSCEKIVRYKSPVESFLIVAKLRGASPLEHLVKNCLERYVCETSGKNVSY